MIDKFLYFIADIHNDVLRKKGIMNDSNYSDIDYVFRSNMWNILVSIFIISIGALIGTLFEVMWLFLVFNVLRERCGGWHSYGNLTYCFLSSTIIFEALSLFCKNFNSYIFIFLAIVSIVYTFFKTPKFCSEEEMYQDKWQFKIDYLILSVLFLLASIPSGYYMCSSCAIILCALYMSEHCEKINIFVRSKIFK